MRPFAVPVASITVGTGRGIFLPGPVQPVCLPFPTRTALFVTLFVEQWLSGKEHMPAIIGVGVTVICLAAVGSTYFLIPALIIITAALILWQNTGRRASDAT